MITGAVCGYLCLSVRQLADVVKQVRAMHPRSQVPTVSLKAQKAPDTRKYRASPAKQTQIKCTTNLKDHRLMLQAAMLKNAMLPSTSGQPSCRD